MKLIETRCAICGTTGGATEVHPANFTLADFNSRVFSARRLPDRLHYRMVRCESCSLVRSDPVLDEESLAELYRESTFDYAEEVQSLRTTYGRAIERLEAVTPAKNGLLDIGTGNGFVLEQALAQGWSDVRGVEPSAHAIAAAHDSVRASIVEDVMRPGLFPADSFDGVTLFQVLDHIPDPLSLLRECRSVLRPGGGILAFNHNVEALSARLLGDRSPIADIEHTYLYSPQTMRRLFELAGFRDISVGPVRNTYSLTYLTHLLPLPSAAKAGVLGGLTRSRLGRRQLTVPLGNLCLVARA